MKQYIVIYTQTGLDGWATSSNTFCADNNDEAVILAKRIMNIVRKGSGSIGSGRLFNLTDDIEVLER